LIGQPPNSTTFNSKPVVEPIIFGAPPTVYTPKNIKLLAIVMSVLLLFATSDSLFGIFKLLNFS